MARKSDFITEARQHARSLWNALNALEALQKEWNALDYLNQLDAGEGENAGLNAAEVGAVVFDTANALRTTLNAGHATNLAKLL
jgi:hypothetical protein